MKIKFVFLFYFASTFGLLFAQTTYDLFALKGLKYGILYEDSYANNKVSNASFFYDGDTIINGLELLRFAPYTYTPNKQYLYVEGKKVYLYDGYKTLLYDFGLQVNDTFEFYPNSKKYIVLKRENNIYQDGKSRVYLQLKSLNSNYTIEWIEGIGDLKMGTFYEHYFHPYDLRFVCASSDDGIIYIKEQSEFPCDSSLFCKKAISAFTTSLDGLKINFHNNSHNFIDQIWDFGDGSFSNEKNPSHKYDSPGCKEIKLTTISICGDTSIISNSVNFCMKGDWQIDKKFKFEDRAIYDMNYIDSLRLWVANRDSIFFSDNGGITFKNITPNLNFKYSIKKLYFDGKFATMLVRGTVNNKSKHIVYFSDDGGQNWINTIETIGYNGDLLHHNDSETFIFRPNQGPINFRYISTNNGRDWAEFIIPNIDTYPFIYILNNSTIVVPYTLNKDSLKQPYLEYTQDSGLNWTNYPIKSYEKMYILNENTSYFITEDNALMVSNDLMKTSTKVYQFTTDLSYFYLLFLDEERGFLLGNDEHFYTLDGGKSWSYANCGKQNFSQELVDYNHEIFALKNNNLFRFSPPEIDEQCFKSSSDDQFILLKNPKIFPNPIFEGEMVEVANLQLDEIYLVEIANAFGQRIVSQKPIDNRIDTSLLPKGLYFITLRDKNLKIVNTIKLVIL